MEFGWLDATVLGLVEGLTEFIPVSSTGHLILAGHLLGLEGEKAKVFEVFIQLGAILAVAWLYFERLWGLLRPAAQGGLRGFNGLLCVGLGCAPGLVLGAAFSSKIKAYLFYPIPVAVALVVGAVLILLVESRRKPATISSLDQITPKISFGIGLVQALSLWPGMSRAATSIIGGMALGLERKVAAEFSFLMAVPLIFAASFYDLYKNWSLMSVDDISPFALGLLVAFVSAIAAVKGFIALLSRTSLAPFAYYRIVLGIAVLIFLQ